MQLRALFFYGVLSSAFAAAPALAQDRPMVPGGRDTSNVTLDTSNVLNDTTSNRGPSVACDSGRVSTTMPPTTGTGTVTPQPCGAIIRDTVSGTVGVDSTSHPSIPDKPNDGTTIPPQLPSDGGTASGNPPTGGTVSSPPPMTPRS